MASIPPSLSGLLGPLVELLESPSVRRIVVDRPGQATVITVQGRETVPVALDAAGLTRMVKGLAQRASRDVEAGHPVEAMLRDGTRFLVVGPPVVPGPVVSISRPVGAGSVAWGLLAEPLSRALSAGLNVLVVSPGDLRAYLGLAALAPMARTFALCAAHAPHPTGAVRLQADGADSAWRLMSGLAPDRVYVDDAEPGAVWAATAALSQRVAPVIMRLAGRTVDDGLARLEALARAGAPAGAAAAVDGFIASGLDLVVSVVAGAPRLWGVRAERGLPTSVALDTLAAVDAYLGGLGVPGAADGEALPGKTVVARVELPLDEPSAPAASESSESGEAEQADPSPSSGLVQAAAEVSTAPRPERPTAHDPQAQVDAPKLVPDAEESVPPSEPPAPLIEEPPRPASEPSASVALEPPHSDALAAATGSVGPAIVAPPSAPAAPLSPSASVDVPGPDPEGILVPASQPAAPAPEDSIDIEIDLSMVTRSHAVEPHDSLGGATAAEGRPPQARPTEDPLRALLESLSADDEDEDEDESVNTMVSQLDDALGVDAADALSGRSFSEILRSMSGEFVDDDSVDYAADSDLPRGRRGSTRVHPDED